MYLLKTKKAKTVTEAAEMIGRNRVTVQDWLGKYRQGGLEKLLSKKVSTGRPRKVPQWAEKTLEKRLKEKEGFDNYGEICEWLKEKLGIEAKYKTVHTLVYYRLKASPKIARPKSLEQSEERLEDFKKNFNSMVLDIAKNYLKILNPLHKIKKSKDVELERLERATVKFSVLANYVALLGGQIKSKQMISGSMSDILSNL